jgi:tetratricopeptide (TPR) repeat protein
VKFAALLFVLVAALLGGVAWFAWFAPANDARGPAPQQPDAAPEAPLDLPDAHPSWKPSPPTDAPVPWTRLNDEGIAALGVGDLERAIAAFEACMEANPDEPVYARNLAEALARAAVELHEAGSLEQRLAAMALLERAVGLDPSREKLRELLERWKRSAAAEEGFFVHPTVHFDVAYDLDRNEVRGEIDQIGLLLEDAYLEFGEAFALWPVESGRPRIRVVLYTREGFDRVTGIGPWAGGVYDGTIRVPVGDLRRELVRVRRVLRHELLHAFVQEAGGATVPAWLNEGLAQWLEGETSAARRAEVERARGKLVDQELFELEGLTGSLASWSDPAAIERAYAQALALVGWISRHYGERAPFDMVAGCESGTAASVTFESRFGLSLGAVLEDLKRDL